MTDGVDNHGNNERCTFRANVPMLLRATEFSTERYFDYVTIAGVRYSGTNGPSDVRLMGGETFTWRTDSSVTYPGFVICALAELNLSCCS